MPVRPDREPGMAQVLCRVLLYCVILAVALFSLGVGYLLVLGIPEGIGEQLSLQQIVESIVSLRPEGIISLGIIVVVATPLLRILATMMMSIQRRDLAITSLTVLSFSSIILAFIIKTLI